MRWLFQKKRKDVLIIDGTIKHRGQNPYIEGFIRIVRPSTYTFQTKEELLEMTSSPH